MSDPSGPFAVPNFAKPADDADDAEFDDEYGDGTDDEGFDDEGPDGEGIGDAVDGERDVTAAVVEDVEDVVPVEAVDGGVAQEVLEHIARSIVDQPDAVRVDVSGQRGGVRLDLHVAPSDMGRIIGRRGRVAQALRSVVRAAAAKDGKDATVDIVD